MSEYVIIYHFRGRIPMMIDRISKTAIPRLLRMMLMELEESSVSRSF